MRIITPFLLFLSPLALADDCPDGEQMYQGQCRTTCEILAQDSSPRGMRWDGTEWGDAPTGYCRGSGAVGCEMSRTGSTIQVNGSIFWQGDFIYTGATCSSVGDYSGDSPLTEPDDGSEGSEGSEGGDSTGSETDSGSGGDGDVDHGGGGNGGAPGGAYPDSSHPINHLRSIQEKQVISNNLLNRNTNEIIELNSSVTGRLTDIYSHLNTEQVNTNNARNELKSKVSDIGFKLGDANSTLNDQLDEQRSIDNTLKSVLDTLNSIDDNTDGPSNGGGGGFPSDALTALQTTANSTESLRWYFDQSRKQIDVIAANSQKQNMYTLDVEDSVNRASYDITEKVWAVKTETGKVVKNTNTIKQNTNKINTSVGKVEQAIQSQEESLNEALARIEEAIISGNGGGTGDGGSDNSDVVGKLGDLQGDMNASLGSLGDALDGIQDGLDSLNSGEGFDAPVAGNGWSSGTIIGESVDGLISDIEHLEREIQELREQSPLKLGQMNFNDGSYSSEVFTLSRDSWSVDVSFNLFDTLGSNTNTIRMIIYFAALLMAAFIILSSGRKSN